MSDKVEATTGIKEVKKSLLFLDGRKLFSLKFQSIEKKCHAHVVTSVQNAKIIENLKLRNRHSMNVCKGVNVKSLTNGNAKREQIEKWSQCVMAKT